MDKPKRKSQKRFEQLNVLVDAVAPSLPTPAHVAVLLCCFRHAREWGQFQVSTKRIAASSCLSERHAKRVIDDLENWQVIRLEVEHNGPIPRRYRITGNPVNGDAHVTNTLCKHPKLMVTSEAVNGDI